MKYNSVYPVGKTFYLSCNKGGAWLPLNDQAQVLNAAKFNMYRHKRLLRASFNYSNCRMYMETLVGHRDPPADPNSKEGFEVTRDMERLTSVEVHWDFPHRYDVDMAAEGPVEIKGSLRPQRWMMASWYKQILTKTRGLKYSYTPVYTGNLGRDGLRMLKIRSSVNLWTKLISFLICLV